MASPQTENGYLRIANELQDAFCTVDLSGSAWRCLHTILRKTYGFNKKEDRISLTQFEEQTGLSRKSVTRGLNELFGKGIIVKTDGFIIKYSLNKNYEKWGSVKPVASDKNDTKASVKPVTKTGDKNDTHKRHKDIKTIGELRSQGLSIKKKKMAWKKPYNENAHTDDIPAVDLETGEMVKEEKVRSTCYKVFELFEVAFQRATPPHWVKHRTIRAAAERLWATKGEAKIRHALKIYMENNDKEFCPAIDTPHDLEFKWVKLFQFAKRNNLV